MKLWTIQPLKFYENLLSKEELTSSKKWINFDFDSAYEYMIEQMEKRIGPRPNNNVYPIWAWYQFDNSKSKRPDLRCSALLKRGEKGVRIEFKKQENDVLLSDFQLWHYVINFWYLADNMEKTNHFDRLLEKHNIPFIDKENYPPTLKKIVKDSWDKVFDMDFDQDDELLQFKNKSIQATFWNSHISEVKKVDFFTAR